MPKPSASPKGQPTAASPQPVQREHRHFNQSLEKGLAVLEAFSAGR